jgi:hypothetical protein
MNDTVGMGMTKYYFATGGPYCTVKISKNWEVSLLKVSDCGQNRIGIARLTGITEEISSVPSVIWSNGLGRCNIAWGGSEKH